MTFDELRRRLPDSLTIPTLGGRSWLGIRNPVGGALRAVSSKGSTYRISREDWENVSAIRERHRATPWRTALYCELSQYFSYGLSYAAALQKYLEGEGAGRPAWAR